MSGVLSGKGYVGLANLGNTCFLNACIQSLNHTIEIAQLRPHYEPFIRPDRPDSVIIREYMELREIMTQNNGVVSPDKFVHQVHTLARQKNRDLFTGWAQNDMPEFLLFMIDAMHNSISRGIPVHISGKSEHSVDELAMQCYGMLKSVYEKEYSEIMDLFYGIYVSEIKSKNGKIRHSLKPESFFILDIPIAPQKDPAKRISLYDCFDVFTATEYMHGENAWWNEKTGRKEDIQKRITFWNFPKVLVITLKRFTPDGLRKIEDWVDFPLENLDLSAYVSGYSPSSYCYDLYSVCNHFGGVQGGHYTAFVKRPDGDEWLHANDTRIDRISRPSDEIITPHAYCLFYRKRPASSEKK